MKTLSPVINSLNGTKLPGALDFMHNLADGEKRLVEGTTIEVTANLIGNIFIRFAHLFGVGLPFPSKNIPTKSYVSQVGDKAIWDRRFQFGKKELRFKTELFQRGNVLYEMGDGGFGFTVNIGYEKDTVLFKGTGYLLSLGEKIKIPFPLQLFLGNLLVKQKSLGDRKFSIDLQMLHPLFGKVFSYRGEYQISRS